MWIGEATTFAHFLKGVEGPGAGGVVTAALFGAGVGAETGVEVDDFVAGTGVLLRFPCKT